MALDDDKRQFEENWQVAVRKSAEIARWKPDILGPSIKDYRESPSKPEIEALLNQLDDELLVEAQKYGLSKADFWDDVKKYVAEEAKYAVRNDQTEILKQAEAEAEAARPDTARAEKHKIHKIFKNCLRRIGWLPKLSVPIPLTSKRINLTPGAIRGKFKEQDVKQLGEEMSAEDLMDIVNDIQFRTADLSNIDAELAQLADRISQLETEVVMTNDEAEKETIRIRIQDIRENVAAATQNRMGHLENLEIQQNKYDILMALIKSELQAEGEEMQKRWGQDIDNITNKAQELITALDNANRGKDAAYQMKLRNEIRKLERQLNDVKNGIVEHLTKNPIFLFERFVGVGSVPLLNRLGQASSIIAGAELPDVDRPGSKIPYKTKP